MSERLPEELDVDLARFTRARSTLLQTGQAGQERSNGRLSSTRRRTRRTPRHSLPSPPPLCATPSSRVSTALHSQRMPRSTKRSKQTMLQVHPTGQVALKGVEPRAITEPSTASSPRSRRELLRESFARPQRDLDDRGPTQRVSRLTRATLPSRRRRLDWTRTGRTPRWTTGRAGPAAAAVGRK